MKEKIKKLYCDLIGRTWVQAILIGFLVALCFAEIKAILIDVRTVYPSIEFYNTSQSRRMVRFSDPVTPSDIQPWMTFAYINTVFKLPGSYLQGALSISDLRYPNISITRYARMHRMNEVQFLASLEQAVSAYVK